VTRVALTFDAEHPDRSAWSRANAGRILDELAGVGVRCTFFVQSRWAEAEPVVARRIAAEGHLIGNHSAYHARMTLLSDDGVRSDVAHAERTIGTITGADTRPWFRCPFGDGHDDERVLSLLDGIGYRNVHWNVEPSDWESSRTAGDVADDTTARALEHGDGAVVLLHTWPDATSGAIAQIVDGLTRAGATLVTVDELDALP
jgi:peptidoglycan/xylan/chitin deacetylase (PgdA/CDA1 family)